MRQPKPFKRKQTQSYYLKLGKDFINLGKDETEAWEKYHEIMAKHRKQTVTEADAVSHLLDLRWTWVKAHRAETTADRLKPILKSFGMFVGPKLSVRKLKPHHVTSWLTEKYSHVSDTRRHTLITAIKGSLQWAADEGYIEVSPIAKMKKPEPAVRQEFLLAEVWPQVLGLSTDDQFTEFLTVMLDSGARVAEIFKAEARHLDGERLIFQVKESKGKKKNRVVWLPEASLKIVTRLAKEHPTGKLFRNRKGRAWNRNSIRLRFKRLKKLLKIPGLTATTLRHSFAHHRLISGQEPLVISKLLGHADGRMLATRYGHLEQNNEFMAAQANRIDSPLQRAS